MTFESDVSGTLTNARSEVQDGSAHVAEASSRHAKKRHTSKEKQHQKPVETEIATGEVRLIWTREPEEMPQTLDVPKTQNSTAKQKRVQPKPIQKKIVPRPAPVPVEKPKSVEPAIPKPLVPEARLSQEDLELEPAPEAVLDFLGTFAPMPPPDDPQPEGLKPLSFSSDLTESEWTESAPLSKYRRSFWDEQVVSSPSEAYAKRSMLPPTPGATAQEEQPAQPQLAHVNTLPGLEGAVSPSANPLQQPEVMNAAADASRRLFGRRRKQTGVQSTAVKETITAVPADVGTAAFEAPRSVPRPPLEAVPLTHPSADVESHLRAAALFATASHEMPPPDDPQPEAPANIQDESYSTAISPPEFQSQLTGDAALSQVTPHEIIPQERAFHLQDVLKLAKTIKIDGVHLSEMFNAQRIDEAGLRAVVAAFLRGADVRRQLTEEIIAKEMTYERDPELRHQSSGQVRTKVHSESTKTLGQKTFDLTRASQKAFSAAKEEISAGVEHITRELRYQPQSFRVLGIVAVVVIYLIIIILLLS